MRENETDFCATVRFWYAIRNEPIFLVVLNETHTQFYLLYRALLPTIAE